MVAITLYDLDVTGGRRPSPFCWRAKFALAHKRLSWDEVAVGFTAKDKIAFADARTVPVLVDHGHGGKGVKDSWDIAVHLDEAYPDYTVMGAFMWARTICALPLLADDDPLHDWIGRMLDLFDGMGRAHKTAA